MEKANAIQEVAKIGSISKSAQKNFADQLIAQVINGEVDPIQAYAQIKGVFESLQLFLKDKTIIDATISACAKFGKETPVYGGAKLTITEAGIKYDYSVCEDLVWNDLNEQKIAVEQKMKARETFLKSINVSQTIVDEQTGAIIKVFPPAKTCSTVVKVNFTK